MEKILEIKGGEEKEAHFYYREFFGFLIVKAYAFSLAQTFECAPDSDNRDNRCRFGCCRGKGCCERQQRGCRCSPCGFAQNTSLCSEWTQVFLENIDTKRIRVKNLLANVDRGVFTEIACGRYKAYAVSGKLTSSPVYFRIVRFSEGKTSILFDRSNDYARIERTRYHGTCLRIDIHYQTVDQR